VRGHSPAASLIIENQANVSAKLGGGNDLSTSGPRLVPLVSAFALTSLISNVPCEVPALIKNAVKMRTPNQLPPGDLGKSWTVFAAGVRKCSRLLQWNGSRSG
jgi:hypothetical protein